jgi:hypothetical protein
MDTASLAQLFGLAVLVVVVLSISMIALRRSVLTRSGAMDVSRDHRVDCTGNRSSSVRAGRRWAPNPTCCR